ncbi:MAG TPA: hypothetical protein VII56_11110 [Rhizomicrobium sp.]
MTNQTRHVDIEQQRAKRAAARTFLLIGPRGLTESARRGFLSNDISQFIQEVEAQIADLNLDFRYPPSPTQKKTRRPALQFQSPEARPLCAQLQILSKRRASLCSRHARGDEAGECTVPLADLPHRI